MVFRSGVSTQGIKPHNIVDEMDQKLTGLKLSISRKNDRRNCGRKMLPLFVKKGPGGSGSVRVCALR